MNADIHFGIFKKQLPIFIPVIFVVAGVAVGNGLFSDLERAGQCFFRQTALVVGDFVDTAAVDAFCGGNSH